MDPERLQPKPQPERRQPEMQRAPQIQRPEPPRPEPQRPSRPDRPGDISDSGGAPPAGPPPTRVGTPHAGPPSATPPGPPTQPKPAMAGMLPKIVAVAVLALGGWFYFGAGGSKSYSGPPEDASPNYQKNKQFNGSQPMQLSPRDMDRARTEAVRQAALRGQPLPGITNPSQALIDAAKNGQLTFYSVRVWDTCAEDGDVVTIRIPIGGEIGPIPLTNAGTVVSVPVVTGQPASVTIVAVKDGVGGVTLGAQTSTGVWFSEVMPVGGTETMPLAQ